MGMKKSDAEKIFWQIQGFELSRCFDRPAYEMIHAGAYFVNSTPLRAFSASFQ